MTAAQVLQKHGIKPNKSTSAINPMVDSIVGNFKTMVESSKKQTSNTKIAERAAEINKDIKVKKGLSRNDLMLQAKAKGIKNFRILNKVELCKVLDPSTIQQDIDGIVADAISRWKSGWGTRKVNNV